jgi:hypothetical protein
MPRWQTRLWPVVQLLNSMLECRSPQRFRVLYYLERIIAKISRRPFQFRYLWTSRNG